MDDLVKRLHEEANLIYGSPPCGLLCEAADRIEQLEAAYSQQQQVWSDAIARADRYEAALNKCVDIVETYRIPVGNSAAGEMACEWTYDALKQIRDDMKDVISAALAGEKKDD